MEEFVKQLTDVNSAINNFVWVTLGLALLLGTGVLMTVPTKFFQISHLAHWWKSTIGSLFKRDVIRHTNDKASMSTAVCAKKMSNPSCPMIRISKPKPKRRWTKNNTICTKKHR